MPLLLFIWPEQKEVRIERRLCASARLLTAWPAHGVHKLVDVDACARILTEEPINCQQCRRLEIHVGVDKEHEWFMLPHLKSLPQSLEVAARSSYVGGRRHSSLARWLLWEERQVKVQGGFWHVHIVAMQEQLSVTNEPVRIG